MRVSVRRDESRGRHLLRALLALVAAMALAGGLAACGGGEDDSADARGEVVITCLACENSPEDPFYQFYNQVAEEFNEQYAGRYRIKVLKKPGATGTERAQHYQRLALADDLPDILEVSPTEVVKLIPTGKLVDFAPVLEEDSAWKASFYDDALGPVTDEDGKVWAVPVTRDSIGIFYNRAILRDAGVSGVPQTWSDFRAACEKIEAIGKTCTALDGAWTTMLMWSNLIGTDPDGGVDFLNGGIADSDDYSSVPAVVKATETLKGWHDAGFVNTDSFSGDYQSAATAFVRGQAATIANGPWMVPEIKAKNAAKGLYEQVGYESSPGWTADARGLIVTSAIGSMASGAKSDAEREAVTAFMKLLTSERNAFQLTQVTGSYPAAKTNLSAADEKQLEPLAARVAEESTTVPTTFVHASFYAPPAFLDAWQNLWPAYVKGDMSTQDFLSQLAQDASSPTG
jgi:raffinose/stachyose/melibiose transport system substrate-binding protein